jgi:hypothetical protein
MDGAVKKDFKLIVGSEETETMSEADKSAIKDELQRYPLFGLSVGSFLQVIAMEQQTCMLEVYHSTNHYGHFCFVGGALYDAVCGDMDGEEAAMEMISWENVRLNIKQIVNTKSIERKIVKNLMLLLMESSRRSDEVQENINDQEMEDGEELDEMEAIADDVERTKLETCLNILIKDMGDALTGAAISSIDEGKVMASHNASPESAEALLRMTSHLRNAFTNNLKVELGDHFIMDLKGQQTLVILLFGEYQWCIIFNNAKCTLGLFRNVVMPKVVKTFTEMNL